MDGPMRLTKRHFALAEWFPAIWEILQSAHL